ncbi:MAG: glycosyltransferase family 1 protein [Chloroflexota bacterium]|nr:glycosyltransferase family 1 protein [Chloroflexota bacterium]
MKIAIEALGIHNYGGGRTAILNLLHNLLAIDQSNQYLVILSQLEPSLSTPAGNMQQLVMPIKNRFLARVWAQMYLPIKLRNYDLVHFTKNLGVFGMPIPTIITIYDMTTLIHPELFPMLDVLYWQHIQERSLQRADRVIAISHNTKQAIMSFYQVETDKIAVIYPSVSLCFQPSSPQRIAQIQLKYQLPEKFILHVGRLDRKKNITCLVEGFAHFRQQLNHDYAGKLVIVGGKYAKSPDSDLVPTIQRLGLKQDIIFTGRVPDADLAPLYSGAQVVVLTSHHEGFGLVAVEAMACGTALIAHRTGAIPEVVGEAAVLLDDIDPQSLAAAIHSVVGDSLLREKLRQAGLQRARRFQTRDDARETLKLYTEVTVDDRE